MALTRITLVSSLCYKTYIARPNRFSKDAYGNENGLGLTQEDAVRYMSKLAAEAAKYGMSTGLKNAEEIIPSVIDFVQFAVNEECVTVDGGCGVYSGFGKPVYHIEYPSSHTVSPSDRERYCQP